MVNKKEQSAFATDVATMLKDGGVTTEWFLKNVKMSRSHWYFIRKGERPLTEGKKDKIISVLKSRSLIS